jgi:two-component system response regulator ChvI
VVPQTNGLVAVVDDEANIRETVGYALRREGFPVETHADGVSAWEAFDRQLPGLAILDILLPQLDGLELCRRLRQRSETLPILFLSSRDEELDRVLGLELGADDYLCKPFSIRELVARVRVLFRRAAHLARPRGETDLLLAVGELTLDLQRYTAALGERPVPLTVTEFLLLQTLVRHPGHVKTRRQLMEQGYPHDAYVSDRTIDSHIKRLRQKLIVVDPGFDSIETVYGLGYRFRQG